MREGSAVVRFAPGRTRFALGIAVCSFAVVLLVVLIPLGSGTTPAPNVTAPYTGAYVAPNTYWSSYGCGKGSAFTSMRWSATTGAVGFSASTSGKSSCPTSGTLGGSGSGSVSGYLQVAIPFSLPSGHHSVQPNWTLAYSAVEKFLILKPCPKVVPPSTGYVSQSCSVSASFGFGFSAYLTDQTNGSYFGTNTNFPGVNNFSYQDNNTYCSSGSCTYSNYSYGGPASLSISLPWHWYINGTFNSSHVYVLWTTLYAYASASAMHYRSSFAAGTISLRNGTTPTRLNSIVVV